MALNYEVLVKSIIQPLIVNPEQLVVKTIFTDDKTIHLQVFVNETDLGRVIGKGGKIASAIRTIVYAGASKEGKRVNLDIDAI
jgi:predicted RNA-binding protein YlqC (UPF0109 family)